MTLVKVVVVCDEVGCEEQFEAIGVFRRDGNGSDFDVELPDAWQRTVYWMRESGEVFCPEHAEELWKKHGKIPLFVGDPYT